ncbi:hypothetical protein NDN08_003383 [Rhodosorus marinus]|uniref:ABC1 atypical kinase-like domain-containing protein n=1 Tax=Rhodosorus marinus TaxID=101924 RepID=A0AAV8UWK0_9RHOD|nr:hypothetical protein NDN08_003383 [Rhodosorus marinus]
MARPGFASSIRRWAVFKYWKFYLSMVAFLAGMALLVAVGVGYGVLPVLAVLSVSAGAFVLNYRTNSLLRRRLTVYKSSLIAFADYKLLRRKTKRLFPDNDTCPECLEMWEEVNTRNARRAYEVFVSLEGLWIKAGQYLSSRADVLPDVFIMTLSKCQDEVPSKDLDDIRETIESEFGRPLSSVFEFFDPKPLACASIAQVHRATFRGEDVVVKVQHKAIKEVIEQDLENLRRIVSWFAWAEPDFDFRPLMNEWSKEVPYELDFIHEAENLRRVERESLEAVRSRKDLGMSFKAIFPQVYDELLTEKVLVMNYIDGFKVSDIKELDARKVDRVALIQDIARAYGNQIFRFGFFNADPHPGNILVVAEKGKKATPALLDFGLTKEIDEKTQRGFSKLVLAAADGDISMLLNSLDDVGVKFNFNSQIIAKESLKMTKFFFRDSGKRKTAQLKEEKAKRKEKQKEIKLQDDESLGRNPVDAFPESLVFFQRTIFLIRGLATLLEVHLQYLDLLVPFAKSNLRGTFQIDKPFPFPRTIEVQSQLSAKLINLAAKLERDGSLTGCQIVVWQNGQFLAEIACGRRDKYTENAVTPSTLFNVYSCTKALTAMALHRCVEMELVNYSDYIHQHWPRFRTKCTVEQVLRHTSGLQNAGGEAIEKNFFSVCNWDRMIRLMEEADPTTAPGSEESYHYLSFGWIVGGLVEKVSKTPFREFVRREITGPLGIVDEMQIGLEDPMNENLAMVCFDLEGEKKKMKRKLGRAALTGQLGKRMKDIHELANSEAAEKGLMSNPTMFNHISVKEAAIPAANGHFSARALAKLYATLANGGVIPGTSKRLLKAETVALLNSFSSVSRPNAQEAGYGLGLQVFRTDADDPAPVFGHSGIGGSLGGCDPRSKTAFGLTLNQLTFDHGAGFEIMKLIFDALGLQPLAAFNNGGMIERNQLLAMA